MQTFGDVKMAPGGAYMLTLSQMLLVALTTPEETPAFRVMHERIERVFAMFVSGRARSARTSNLGETF